MPFDPIPLDPECIASSARPPKNAWAKTEEITRSLNGWNYAEVAHICISIGLPAAVRSGLSKEQILMRVRRMLDAIEQAKRRATEGWSAEEGNHGD